VQLAQLDFVMAHSSPGELVMDGWQGMGVFRPHAWYYFFLHPEVRGMLPPAQLRAFEERLQGGEVRPKLVVMDRNLRLLSGRFLDFVQKHYEKAGDNVWIRKPPQPGSLRVGQ
jgi:hypothetical protein